jgi:hypothetical protein
VFFKLRFAFSAGNLIGTFIIFAISATTLFTFLKVVAPFLFALQYLKAAKMRVAKNSDWCVSNLQASPAAFCSSCFVGLWVAFKISTKTSSNDSTSLSISVMESTFGSTPPGIAPRSNLTMVSGFAVFATRPDIAATKKGKKQKGAAKS